MLSLAAAFPAQAKPPGAKPPEAKSRETNIAGDWHFIAGDAVCHFEGDIEFRPAAHLHAYACSFIVVTHCQAGFGDWRVRETCQASQAGGKIAIVSRIEDILERASPGLGEEYAPDNFDLTLSPNGAEMNGAQIDPFRTSFAKFTRLGALVS